MNIVSPYPLWYFVFCIVLGALLAFLLYRKDKKLAEFSKLTKGVLFGLRFLCISVLAAMLLSPLLKYFSKTVEKPIIVIAQDNSASMKMAADSVFVTKNLQEQLANIEEELAKEYRVESFLFDERIISAEAAPQFDGQITDFDVLFENLEQKYANRNVGGLLLISDGIYNQGNSPIYSVRESEFPVFTVGVGDTNKYVDVQLRNLRNNKLAFLGNEFPVQVDVRTQKLTEKSLKISIYRGSKLITSTAVTALKPNGISTQYFKLKADVAGKQQYTIRVETVDGERNTLNNSLNFYIDVLDGRQKVLLLGMAPHPDVRAIKSALNSNENYELTSELFSKFSKPIKDFDLIILHQAANVGTVVIDQKMKKILATKTPLLLFGGGWSAIEQQQGITNKTAGKNMVNQVQAEINEGFSLFTVDQNLRKLSQFPPLATEASRMKSNGNKTLLTQKIGNVKTEYPLLSFFEKKGRKIGRFNGEGIWKWRIADYQEYGNHEVMNRFLSKVIQYMAVKADRSFFRVSAVDEVYENESISFSAQLFNPSYELVNDPEVSLKLVDAGKREFTFEMNRSGTSYQLTIPSLAPSTYSYEATSTFQGKKVLEKGVFTVKALQLEASNTEADHQVLFQLAERTNGKVIAKDALKNFPQLLKGREDITSVSYLNEEVEDIINLKWIFFLIIGLLSIEWFIRKRGGAY